MPDDNNDVLKTIEALERARPSTAHAEAAMRTKCQKHLPKLREVIESLNEECAPE